MVRPPFSRNDLTCRVCAKKGTSTAYSPEEIPQSQKAVQCFCLCSRPIRTLTKQTGTPSELSESQKSFVTTIEKDRGSDPGTRRKFRRVSRGPRKREHTQRNLGSRQSALSGAASEAGGGSAPQHSLSNPSIKSTGPPNEEETYEYETYEPVSPQSTVCPTTGGQVFTGADPGSRSDGSRSLAAAPQSESSEEETLRRELGIFLRNS